MKNLMPFIHPSKAFLEEHKTSIKIQIDNSLSLGWKVSDIILATNFPYEYSGVKSLVVSDDNYCSFCPTVSCMNVIVELFDRKLIEKDEVYWLHDLDAYQLYGITESELDLGEVDMGVGEMGIKPKLGTCSIFFKSSAKDIFLWIKETAYKYQTNEEDALNALYTNNLLWLTGTESAVRAEFVPLNISGAENLSERIKTLNHSYCFETESIGLIYEIATKPIKVVHFHFNSDLLLDSFLYGKNSLNMVFAPERLIKIFHKHGVKGVPFKKMKNLMIYFRRKELAHINPEKKFLGNTEDLVKRQIDNSLELGWNKEDIMLLTNFPYEYQGVKATVVDNDLFCNINEKAIKSNAIFQLLTQDVVKEAELWWYHDLDVLELRKIESSEIDLEDTAAGFMLDGSDKRSLKGNFQDELSRFPYKLDTGSFFFRKGPHPYQKIFEWMRNRTCRLNTDEATAFMSLTTANYRNINSMYIKLDGNKMAKIFSKRSLKINL